MSRLEPGAHNPTEEEIREFELKLASARDREEAVPPPKLPGGGHVIWKALPGSQTDFIKCTLFEVLFHGTRGPGKTDALLMAFEQRTDRGYGSAWTGIIFRQTYPQLADVVAKSEKWFRRLPPEHRPKFNIAKMCWTWPGGEKLYFRHMNRKEDYWNYHGHEYPFIGWEELTNWATDDCYKAMMSCCRSAVPGVPLMVRATTNPYGPGHTWVKTRFALFGRWWETIVQLAPRSLTGREERPRAAIHGHIDENTILLAADPEYKTTIVGSASNPAMAQAWLSGSWEIVAGGLLSDVFDARHNVLPRFAVPRSWRMDRSFDWGSSAPFSVGWWAQSDGCDLRLPDGRLMSTVRGDLFRIAEWYGWTGKPNQGLGMLATEVAAGIVERELLWGARDLIRPGPADSSIWSVENGMCIANDMARPVRIGDRVHKGVQWTPADKRPGSIKNGLELLRKMLKQAHPNQRGGPREHPGLFVTDACVQWLRVVPPTPRDEKDPDVQPSSYEDHILDETRYRVRACGVATGKAKVVGMY